MNLLTVTKQQEDGSKKLDPNLVVELLLKLAGIAGIFVSVWAVKQSGNAQATATKAETHAVSNSLAVIEQKAALVYLGGSNVIEAANSENK